MIKVKNKQIYAKGGLEVNTTEVICAICYIALAASAATKGKTSPETVIDKLTAIAKSALKEDLENGIKKL